MNTERLDSLLLAWQDHRSQGRDVSPGELCRDCPELAEELTKRIEEIQRLDAQVQADLPTRLKGQTLDSGDEKCPVPLEHGIPGYEILGELGRGGMGVVYKARQQALNRTVALKMILAGSHAGPSALARFLKEAETIAHLKHPNVVQVYEYGNFGGMPYFSLEYLEGGSLAEKIKGEPQEPQ